ncbi:hypothetical protein JKF63_06826 [Porcisia hertigi]|uniref:DNA replication licensing factor MCM4 n=1 Tax=Porcisia hertigi TaxID=2761500 RepID=A0A836LJ71_9TRYP|nr:hypothetical protein JKF63_06826 [Porcisia hertigi]
MSIPMDGDDTSTRFIDLTPVRPNRRREATPQPLPGGADDFGVTTAAPLHDGGLDGGPASSATLGGVSEAVAVSAYSGPTQQRSDDHSYIWGTGIAVEVFRDEFHRHIETFALNQVVAEPPQRTPHPNGCGAVAAETAAKYALQEKYYLKEFLRMHIQGRSTLEVDFTWLQRVAPQLYVQTVHHPTECLQMMSAVADEVYRDVLLHRHGIEVAEDVIITVAAKKLPSIHTLKLLSPQHIEQLLSIKGMVIRVSKIIPEIRVACFQCWNCQYQERSVSGDKGRIFEPTRCPHCGKTYSFKLQHNLSLYEDKQLVKVQESPENVSDGETPISISVVVYGSMVDAVVPGDRVVVTGIYRSTPIRLNANTRIIKSIFATHIDAVHMELVRATRASEAGSKKDALASGNAGSDRLHVATPTLVTTKEAEADLSRAALMDTGRLDIFYTLARRPDIYEILLHSFARTIWGHDDVKRGILAQLFGGTAKTFVFSERAGSASDQANHSRGGGGGGATSSNSAVFRSELNVLLCGDPGVAKSQLLTQVHEIAPRGIYTSGKGSSSVGLTAFVVQDSDTGELVLEPGALVLSDRGLCCIDEFDKMNEATRSVLHEVMEQQTLSIAKAGIIAQLNARTSILAAANPKDSQWNAQLNVVENLQIEPTLLSRFDLIFLLLDCHDPAEDRRLATHVLSLYMDTSGNARTRRGIDNGNSAGGTGLRPQGGRNDNESTDEDETTQWRITGRAGQPAGTSGDAAESENTYVDAATGLPVEVQMEMYGEVFLQGPPDAPYMPASILSEYIALARESISPKLTEASHKQLAQSYVELRQARGSSCTVSATLRQLESMIRLSEALAKMRYSSEVSVEDVMEAKRIISAALKKSATDPTTGLINLDMFHAADPGKNTVEGNMRRLEELLERRFLAQGRRSVAVVELRSLFNEQQLGSARPVAPAQFVELLALLSGGDVVQSFTATTVTLATPGAMRGATAI